MARLSREEHNRPDKAKMLAAAGVRVSSELAGSADQRPDAMV